MRKLDLFRSLLGILIVILLVPIVVLFMRPDSYLGFIERIVSSSSGYELAVGSLEVDAMPLTIAMTNLTVRNPKQTAEEPLLRVDSVQSNVSLFGFLFGGDDWWNAIAEGVLVNYAVDDQGSSNWEMSSTERSSIEARYTKSTETGFPLSSAVFKFNSVKIDDFILRQSVGEDTRLLQLNNVTVTKNINSAVNLALRGRYLDQPLSITGLIPLPDSEGSRKVELDASLFGSVWKIAGTFGEDGDNQAAVQYSIEADDLSSLTSLLGRNFSYVTPLSVTGQISAAPFGQWSAEMNGLIAANAIDMYLSVTIEDSVYEFEQLTVESKPISLSGNGNLDLSANHFTASVNATRLDVDSFLDILPPVGDASQSRASPVRSGSDQTLAIALTEQLTSVENLLDNRSINFDILVDSLIFGGNEYQQLAVKAITEDDTMEFTAELSDLIDAPARFSENVAEVLLELKDDAEAEENSDFVNFFPLMIASTLETKESGLVLDPIEFTFESDLVQGKLDLDLSQNRPIIFGEFQSDRLNVDRFSTTSAEDIEGSGESLDEQSGDVIGDEVIDWSWLSAFELYASVDIALLHFNQSDFHDVLLNIEVAEGKLVVDPLTASLAKGGLEASLRLFQTEDGADLQVHIVATELTPADLGQPNQGLIDGGETDLYIDLRTGGASAQELAQNLNGEFALEVQHATIRNNLIELIGSDVLSQFLNLINPFAKNDGQTELECAAMHFNVEDGVIASSDKLAIETTKMIIRGGGVINLSDETLQIDIVPSARSGLGISLGNLASVVRLGATLGKPTPVADPGGIIRSGATIGAAITTGGLSLLAQGLFDRARNTSTPCGRIFERNVEVPPTLEVDDTNTSGNSTDQ